MQSLARAGGGCLARTNDHPVVFGSFRSRRRDRQTGGQRRGAAGTLWLADAGQQPSHDPLVRIVDGWDPRRCFRRKGRGLLFTLSVCSRKRHPFANDHSASLMLWHHDRVPLSVLNKVVLPMSEAKPVPAGSLDEQLLLARLLSAKDFCPCFNLGPLGLVASHQRSDLMLDGPCRREFYLSSEPVCAHWALLSSAVDCFLEPYQRVLDFTEGRSRAGAFFGSR